MPGLRFVFPTRRPPTPALPREGGGGFCLPPPRGGGRGFLPPPPAGGGGGGGGPTAGRPGRGDPSGAAARGGLDCPDTPWGPTDMPPLFPASIALAFAASIAAAQAAEPTLPELPI